MRMKKDTFQEIFIQYEPIVKGGKGISLLMKKSEMGSKMFHVYQKMIRDGETHAKSYIRNTLSRLPHEFKLMCGETIKLMIEDSLIPLINPDGKYGFLSAKDKYFYSKVWGQSELIKLLWILKLWGSPNVQITKLKKSQVEKETKILKSEFRKLQKV